MCTWNDETPAIVPAGARISAGKLGSVARALPKGAEGSVNRPPPSCIPSPESPANLMTTRSSVSAPRVEVASTVTVDHHLSFACSARLRRERVFVGACSQGRRRFFEMTPTRLNRPRADPLYRRGDPNPVLAPCAQVVD